MEPEKMAEIVMDKIKKVRSEQGLGSGWKFPWKSLRFFIIGQITEAVQAERERSALIAEEYAPIMSCGCSHGIAAKIRGKGE